MIILLTHYEQTNKSANIYVNTTNFLIFSVEKRKTYSIQSGNNTNKLGRKWGKKGNWWYLAIVDKNENKSNVGLKNYFIFLKRKINGQNPAEAGEQVTKNITWNTVHLCEWENDFHRTHKLGCDNELSHNFICFGFSLSSFRRNNLQFFP